MKVKRKLAETVGYRVAGDDEIDPSAQPVCHVVRVWPDRERLCPGYPEEGERFCEFHKDSKEGKEWTVLTAKGKKQ